MNARTASIALLAALVAAPAFADTGVTRAEVSAEYIRARNAGELDYANEFITPVARKASKPDPAAATKHENLPATARGNPRQHGPPNRSAQTPPGLVILIDGGVPPR